MLNHFRAGWQQGFWSKQCLSRTCRNPSKSKQSSRKLSLAMVAGHLSPDPCLPPSVGAGVASLTRVVQAHVACPGQRGGHIIHRHHCTTQREHIMPDRSTGEKTGTLQPMLPHLSTHMSQGLPEERTAVCSPKQAYCLLGSNEN